jgi:serine/threonine protein kinase
MQAVGKLDHPHIVRASDAGEVAGSHFLVMELVKGANLSQLVKLNGPLSIADACELVRQAALGLQHVHECGLVHRDIKPSNLLLSSAGIVKVSDLGLARLRSDVDTFANAQGDDLTATGQLLGTYDYMAPEQAVDIKQVDIRADIYSLGCTLYMILSGNSPFHGPEFDSAVKKLAAHAAKPVSPLRSQRHDIPVALDAAILQMLAKAPQDRVATPAAVAELLAPFCSGSNVTALLRAENVRQPLSNHPLSTVEGHRSTRVDSNAAVPKPLVSNQLTARASRNPWWRTPAWIVAYLLLAAGIAGIIATWSPTDSFHGGANSSSLNPVQRKWTDTFGEAPKFLVWRGFRGIGTMSFRHQDDLKALEVNSTDIRLVKLGELTALGGRLEIGLRQAHPTGGIGLFLGHHIERNRNEDCDTFQLLWLECARPMDKPSFFRMLRWKAYIFPQTGTLHAIHLLGHHEVASPEQVVDPRMELVIRNHRLEKVTWCGVDLNGLVSDYAEDKLSPVDFEGPFGIYSEGETVWCSNPIFEPSTQRDLP